MDLSITCSVRMPVTLRPIGRFSEMSLNYMIASTFLTMIYRTGVGDGQGSLACCSPWGCKKSDMTEWLKWTELNRKEFQLQPGDLCPPFLSHMPSLRPWLMKDQLCRVQIHQAYLISWSLQSQSPSLEYSSLSEMFLACIFIWFNPSHPLGLCPRIVS